MAGPGRLLFGVLESDYPRRVSPRALVFCCVALVIGFAPAARAANDDGFTFGDDADLAAGAVAPLTTSGSAVWYNPAGLGGIARNSLSVSASAFVLRIRTIEGIIRTKLPEGELSSDADNVELLSVPTALVIARRLADGVGGAVGVFVPEQEQFHFRTTEEAETDVGAGETLFQQQFGLAESRQRYHIGLAVGWEVTPCLRLGAGLFAIYATTNRSDSVWAAGTPASGDPGDPGAVGFGTSTNEHEVTTIGGQITLGVQWQALEQLHLSFVVRSPGLVFTRFGSIRGTTGLARNIPGVVEDEQVFSTYDIDPSTAEGSLVLPLRLDFGLAWAWDSGWIAVEGSLSSPIVSPSLNIDRTWTGNARLGFVQRLDETWSLGAGAFTDLASGPQPDVFAEFRLDYVGVTAGVSLDTPLGLLDEERPEGLLMSSTVALRYAVGWGVVGGTTFDPLTPDVGAFVQVHHSPVIFHDVALTLGSKLTF